MKYVKDHYKGCRKKKTISIQIDEEMYYWIGRLADINERQDKEPDTIQRVIRHALYMYLKHFLQNKFRMTESQFKMSNERTGKIYNGNRY